MDRIKIAFFDIDGTILEFEHTEITQKMRETLLGLQKNGIIICIATGRAPISLPHFSGVDFDAYLTFNGSYCYNKQGAIFDNPIPKDEVRRLVDNAAAMGRPVSIATKERLAANGIDDDLVAYYGFAKLNVDIADNFDEIIDTEDVHQIMLGCTMEERPKLLKDVKHAKITAWWDRAVDVIPANGGKGVGVEAMLQYYGFDKSEAMAFGDGDNDIEMLEAVGHGIAMANGSDNVKAIANDICGDVAEDGIYHYCKMHNLI